MIQNSVEHNHYVYSESDPNSLEIIKADNDASLTVSGKILLNRKAAFSLKMASLYLAEVYGKGIKINWGFRSFESQKSVFQRFLSKEKNLRKTLERVAPPGSSEHHTGLAVDIIGDRELLAEIMPCFGWELSFPKDNKQNIRFEPWHWRFIGLPIIRKTLAQKEVESDRRLISLCQKNKLLFAQDNQKLFSSLKQAVKIKDEYKLTVINNLFEEFQYFGNTNGILNDEIHIIKIVEEFCHTQELDAVETIEEAIFILNIYLPLAKTSRGERVKLLQDKLNVLNFLDHKSTAYFGSLTEQAVKKAQNVFNLNETGIADYEFLRLIRKVVDEKMAKSSVTVK